MLLRFLLFSRPFVKLSLILITIIGVGFGLAAPYNQKVFIDELTSDNQILSLKPILLAVGFGIFAQLLNTFMRTLAVRESTIAQQAIAEKLYHHSLLLDSQSRANKTVGQIVSYYASDVSTVGSLVDDFFPNLLSALLPLTIAPIAVSLFYDLPLIRILATTFGCIGICVLLGLRQSGFFAKFKRLAEERISIVNEWLQNMRALRVLGWIELFENKIFKKRRQETLNRLQMVTNGSLLNSITQVSPLLINAVGVMVLIESRQNQVTVGDIFGVLWTLGVFLNRPMRMIPWTLVILMDSLTSVKRLQNYLNLPTEVDILQKQQSQKTEISASSLTADIQVKNLNLIYDGRPILHNISFSIAAGKFIAIVGEVGSGKTQLLNALLRDSRATFENYHIGNVNALDLPLAKLRQHFAYVPQDGFVMSASVRENLAFAYDAETEHDVTLIESATAAEFHFTTEQMAHGLDTEIGERGVNMSGGQRQRISLGRAHYFDRPIILLDDSLSAVDVNTEKRLVQNLLLGEWKNRTRILVTHRFHVLPSVDWIYFLENGEIKAQGTFADLVAKSASARAFFQHEVAT